MIAQVSLDLSIHRLEKAKDLLNQAETLLNTASYDGSINRSYYAIFNAIRALLALIDVDSRRHSGVISFFDRYFVKTGICEKQLSQIAHTAFEVRQINDYEDFAMPTLEQAQQQFDNATQFIANIEQKRELLMQGKIPLPSLT